MNSASLCSSLAGRYDNSIPYSVPSPHRLFKNSSSVSLMISDYDGRRALHLASAEGHLEAVDFLVNTCKVVTKHLLYFSVHNPVET
jgi:hypothetical protein